LSKLNLTSLSDYECKLLFLFEILHKALGVEGNFASVPQFPVLFCSITIRDCFYTLVITCTNPFTNYASVTTSVYPGCVCNFSCFLFRTWGGKRLGRAVREVRLYAYRRSQVRVSAITVIFKKSNFRSDLLLVDCER
jgi:hypothetical protein